MKKFWVLSGFAVFAISLLVSSCGKDDDDNNNQNNTNNNSSISDEALYNRSNNKTGYMYYKNVTDTLNAVGNSPHKPFILVRFNDKALSVLGQDGKLPAGGSFPEDAIIVKEIYDKKGGELKKTAVMMKKPKDPNSEAGWLWSEFSPSGSVLISTADKGSQCVSCHNGQGNRDLVMTFSLH